MTLVTHISPCPANKRMQHPWEETTQPGATMRSWRCQKCGAKSQTQFRKHAGRTRRV